MELPNFANLSDYRSGAIPDDVLQSHLSNKLTNPRKASQNATEMKKAQVLNGTAFKPGGYLYDKVNRDAVKKLHKSGLFYVFDEPPVQAVPQVIDPPIVEDKPVFVSKRVRKE